MQKGTWVRNESNCVRKCNMGFLCAKWNSCACEIEEKYERLPTHFCIFWIEHFALLFHFWCAVNAVRRAVQKWTSSLTFHTILKDAFRLFVIRLVFRCVTSKNSANYERANDVRYVPWSGKSSYLSVSPTIIDYTLRNSVNVTGQKVPKECWLYISITFSDVRKTNELG